MVITEERIWITVIIVIVVAIVLKDERIWIIVIVVMFVINVVKQERAWIIARLHAETLMKKTVILA